MSDTNSADQKQAPAYSDRLVDDIRRALEERDRFRIALRRIANLNNGPDLASGEYRCQEAAAIAARALR